MTHYPPLLLLRWRRGSGTLVRRRIGGGVLIAAGLFGLIEVCLGAVNFLLEESYVLAIVLQTVLIHIAAEVAGFVGQQIFIAFGRTFPSIALRGIGCELFLQLGN